MQDNEHNNNLKQEKQFKVTYENKDQAIKQFRKCIIIDRKTN